MKKRYVTVSTPDENVFHETLEEARDFARREAIRLATGKYDVASVDVYEAVKISRATARRVVDIVEESVSEDERR